MRYGYWVITVSILLLTHVDDVSFSASATDPEPTTMADGAGDQPGPSSSQASGADTCK